MINGMLFGMAIALTILLILVVGLVFNQEKLKERVKHLEGDLEEEGSIRYDVVETNSVIERNW